MDGRKIFFCREKDAILAKRCLVLNAEDGQLALLVIGSGWTS
jgi:hypothetical protein